MTPDMNAVQRAQIYLETIRILRAEPDSPEGAWAYTTAYHEAPEDVLNLAGKIDGYLRPKYTHRGVFVQIDASLLLAICDTATVHLALKLCGIRARVSGGRNGVWTNAPAHVTCPERLPIIQLPESLIDD